MLVRQDKDPTGPFAIITLYVRYPLEAASPLYPGFQLSITAMKDWLNHIRTMSTYESRDLRLFGWLKCYHQANIGAGLWPLWYTSLQYMQHATAWRTLTKNWPEAASPFGFPCRPRPPHPPYAKARVLQFTWY